TAGKTSFTFSPLRLLALFFLSRRLRRLIQFLSFSSEIAILLLKPPIVSEVARFGRQSEELLRSLYRLPAALEPEFLGTDRLVLRTALKLLIACHPVAHTTATKLFHLSW
ncbi:MAG: hypothetical protein U1E10_18885, partial [Bdellovibrionales bacterium]|nr:hypothetical protein [Bdellovibrionales bacterium]